MSTTPRPPHRLKYGSQPVRGEAYEAKAAERDKAASDAAQQREVDLETAARLGPSTSRVFDGPGVDGKAIRHWLATFAAMIERPLDLIRVDQDRRIAICQRCRACRHEIISKIRDTMRDASAWMVDIANLVRHDYAAHQCPPVNADLNAMTVDEQGDLLESTEREAVRVAERAAAIHVAFAERLAKGIR